MDGSLDHETQVKVFLHKFFVSTALNICILVSFILKFGWVCLSNGNWQKKIIIIIISNAKFNKQLTWKCVEQNHKWKTFTCRPLMGCVLLESNVAWKILSQNLEYFTGDILSRLSLNEWSSNKREHKSDKRKNVWCQPLMPHQLGHLASYPHSAAHFFLDNCAPSFGQCRKSICISTSLIVETVTVNFPMHMFKCPIRKWIPRLKGT